MKRVFLATLSFMKRLTPQGDSTLIKNLTIRLFFSYFLKKHCKSTCYAFKAFRVFYKIGKSVEFGHGLPVGIGPTTVSYTT